MYGKCMVLFAVGAAREERAGWEESAMCVDLHVRAGGARALELLFAFLHLCADLSGEVWKEVC